MAHGGTVQIDLSCIYSTIRNTSGGERVFSFLPPHGRKLADQEEFSVFGDLLGAMSQFDRTTDRRRQEALARALGDGDLVIVQTPAPILEDATTGDIKMLKLDSDSLTTADPCWNDSASEQGIAA